MSQLMKKRFPSITSIDVGVMFALFLFPFSFLLLLLYALTQHPPISFIVSIGKQKARIKNKPGRSLLYLKTNKKQDYDAAEELTRA
jgi:hypothetical protein